MANVKYQVFVNGDDIHLQELEIDMQQGDPLSHIFLLFVMKTSQ